MHSFRSFIHQYVVLSEEDWSTIAKNLQQEAVKEQALILEQGKVCKYLYFLESGLLRYYTLRDGEEVTKFFTEAPYAFTSQKSFTDKTPASESIQALEPCMLWKMKVEDAYALLALPAWSEFVRKLIQEVQYFTEQLLLEIQTETAEQRYQKMLDQKSSLVQRVPIKHLASYLGIAPQSLSRIRKQLMK